MYNRPTVNLLYYVLAIFVCTILTDFDITTLLTNIFLFFIFY